MRGKTVTVGGSISGRTAAVRSLPLSSVDQGLAHRLEPDRRVEASVGAVRLALGRFEGNVTAALGRRSEALGRVLSAVEADSRRCAGPGDAEMGSAVSQGREPINGAGVAS